MNDYSAYYTFRSLYQQNGVLTPAQIAGLYSDDVQFRDPVHSINGLAELTRYFAAISSRVSHCRFEFVDELVHNYSAHVTWYMHFSHPRIGGGNLQKLRGMSFIRFEEGRIYYHEDSYDMGALLYEHLPLLGGATRFLKKRLGKNK